MPLISIMVCDAEGCTNEIEIADMPDNAAIHMMQITDCMGEKYYFCSTECTIKFLSTYKNPYLKPENQKGILPGEDLN